ncbi:hypothetical protein KKA14_12680 [bacterium]|nr:hypothetical protein [bacterium]
MKDFRLPFLLTLLLLLFAGSICASEISNEFKAKITAYRIEREAIRNELQAVIGDEQFATREEKNEAIKQWRKKHLERITRLKKLSDTIHVRLQKKVKEQKEKLKDLPPEEQDKAMLEWFGKYSQYLYVKSQPKSLKDAKDEFHQLARQVAKSNQSKYYSKASTKSSRTNSEKDKKDKKDKKK